MTSNHVNERNLMTEFHDASPPYRPLGKIMTFADRLQQARQLRGLTQEKLAKLAAIPPTSLSHFESDQRLPSYRNLGKLADALQVSVDYLMGRTDDPALHGATDPMLNELVRLSARDRVLAEAFVHLLKTIDEQEPRREEMP